ncbi:hypothetical protein K0B96_13980 [Horticoccus luteus]|uniref:Uncharacterized protein n=1 Tax=Horticoccus luteus TaxID=2862869 RepID=A0A8F9TUK4_9BACT|nr:hypothetical protein [Horticoccus luteus]QYM78395.1 hypothetical protein K0B96_13980 [Horticoccus luteus]
MEKKTKSVRFSQVVARSGAPELHSLWLAPAKDAAFQKALKSDRVMTVLTAAGGAHTEHGVVGYESGPRAQFLVFPRSLKAFAGRRVVGIKYDLLQEPAGGESFRPPEPRRKAPPPKLHLAIVDDEAEDGAKPARTARARPSVKEKVKGTVVDFEPPPAAKSEATPSAPRRTEKVRAKMAKRAAGKSTAGADAGRQLARLSAEVKRALKELKQGKAVAAYQRLTAAIAADE